MMRSLWGDKRVVFAFCSLCLLATVGLVGTWVLSTYGETQTLRSFVRTASSAAASLDIETVEALTGTGADVNSPAFKRIQRRLVRVRDANPDARFVYLMAMRDDEVIFLVDAEPLDSPDASTPGDPYPEASQELREAFANGAPFVEGPLKDRWGEWVTGFAPVRDAGEGPVVALLGLDWDARAWREQVGVYHWLGLTLTVFPVLLAGAIFLGFIRVERINLMLTEEMRERRRIQRELERLSKQDALTGLANRRTFDMLLDLEWRRALRAQMPISLIMLDVDRFKAYNDQFGHQAGDDVLKWVGDAIHRAVKRAGDEPARYGGEEFAVVLPGADAEGAWHVAEDIRAIIESAAVPHADGTEREHVTVSVGVATIMPTTDDKPSELLGRADQALYRAKAGGRNRVERDPE